MKVYIQITLVYIVLLLIGGLIGFAKAGSFASLGMSLLFAALLGYATWLMSNNRRVGYFIALFTLGFLALFFLYRLMLTGKFMPAGLMCMLSAFATIAFGYCRKKLGDPNGH